MKEVNWAILHDTDNQNPRVDVFDHSGTVIQTLREYAECFGTITEVQGRGGFANNYWLCRGMMEPGIPFTTEVHITYVKNKRELLGAAIAGSLRIVSRSVTLAYLGNTEEYLRRKRLSDSEFYKGFRSLEADITMSKQAFVDRLQALLSSIKGKEFLDDEKRVVVYDLHRVLTQLNQRVVCPKTHLPGFLRLKKAGRTNKKTFAIEVTERGKRTSRFSSMTFPDLKLVDAPPDARKKDQALDWLLSD